MAGKTHITVKGRGWSPSPGNFDVLAGVTWESAKQRTHKLCLRKSLCNVANSGEFDSTLLWLTYICLGKYSALLRLLNWSKKLFGWFYHDDLVSRWFNRFKGRLHSRLMYSGEDTSCAIKRKIFMTLIWIQLRMNRQVLMLRNLEFKNLANYLHTVLEIPTLRTLKGKYAGTSHRSWYSCVFFSSV